MSIPLPKGEINKGQANWSDVYGNDKALKDAAETLEGKFPVSAANIAAAAKPVVWYTPKIIDTEETRENTAFGTLTTKDEITGVVVPGNGIVAVGCQALWKESVNGAARAAIFIGSNQLKTPAGGSAPETEAATMWGSSEVSSFHWLTSAPVGLMSTGQKMTDAFVTTGQTLGGLAGSVVATYVEIGTDLFEYAKGISATTGLGGFCQIVGLPAGTYSISVQYKATSGSVTAKERKLWVYTLGY